MLCLGIESTAHTFAASVVDCFTNGKRLTIMSDARSVYKPSKGSGIHPREASRHHAIISSRIIGEALSIAKVKNSDISILAYSAGPGLGPCLRIGAVTARSICSFYDKPIMPVNHAIGHIELGIVLTNAQDPLVLLISGGHTLMTIYANKRWRIIGETLDITLGQLFDQFGRYLGLSSPCGANIEQLALKSNLEYIALPYTIKGNDLTFSGLLSAGKRQVLSNMSQQNLCYSLQETAFSMLCEVVERALVVTRKRELLVVGGVAANKRLSEILQKACLRHKVIYHSIPLNYCGDNGVQIAWTGAIEYFSGKNKRLGPSRAFVRQSWRLDDVNITWKE
ncbi:MAG TPA: KEOPS complex N(6)-L-threonylcarbamoyladenine synthase Kae1 [Nitrososphaeraceae archaeon]